jgi:hypothetical protein
VRSSLRWGESGEPDGENRDANGGGVGDVVRCLGQHPQRAGTDTHEKKTGNQTKVEAQDNPKTSSTAQCGRVAHSDSLIHEAKSRGLVPAPVDPVPGYPCTIYSGGSVVTKCELGRGQVDRDPPQRPGRPLEMMAARTRSRASRTAASGRPTMVKPGSPFETCTSTETACPTAPVRVAEATAASTQGNGRTGSASPRPK